MNPVWKMLTELFPDKDKQFKQMVLWDCCCYPMMGGDEEAAEYYRKQIIKCIEARPDDPVGWAYEQMDKAMGNRVDG